MRIIFRTKECFRKLGSSIRFYVNISVEYKVQYNISINKYLKNNKITNKILHM